MKKSIVGDPIIWPGLIYSPINIQGLLYALGTVSASVGLLFEEFNHADNTAVCRRKTDSGWQRTNVAFALRSSEFSNDAADIDYLICWINDSADDPGVPLLILSEMMGGAAGSQNVNPVSVENIFPEDPAEDLRIRSEVKGNFENAVRDLDARIKKLKTP
jgi:hypothetical protein